MIKQIISPTELITEHWYDIEQDKTKLRNALDRAEFDLKEAYRALDACVETLQWWVDCDDDSDFMERAKGAIRQANR